MVEPGTDELLLLFVDFRELDFLFRCQFQLYARVAIGKLQLCLAAQCQPEVADTVQQNGLDFLGLFGGQIQLAFQIVPPMFSNCLWIYGFHHDPPADLCGENPAGNRACQKQREQIKTDFPSGHNFQGTI